MKLKKPGDQPIPRNRKTQRPPKLTKFEIEDPELEDEFAYQADHQTCKFTFRVFWENSVNRWFVPNMQSGCTHHNGHPQIDHPLLCSLPRHTITSEELDMAETDLDSEITPSQTYALVEAQTGINLD